VPSAIEGNAITFFKRARASRRVYGANAVNTWRMSRRSHVLCPARLKLRQGKPHVSMSWDRRVVMHIKHALTPWLVAHCSHVLVVRRNFFSPRNLRGRW
jgi:hypothetical protein